MRWVIVAHPDDELIFAGGAMLKHPDSRWRVVVATHEETSPRAAEALAARDALRGLGLKVDYIFLGETDEQWHRTGGIDPDRMAGRLRALGVRPGGRVYTHGEPGEYGHNAHRAVHRIVTGALGGTASISTFSGGAEVVERINDPKTLELKADLFNRAYPSQKGVWIGLADMMREVMTEERHFAFSRVAEAER